MRIAILSDIHANWQGLEAVLDDCPAVDETLCLGDVVGYGGDPIRCLDEVVRRGWLTLVGNHDRACTDPAILEWFNDDAATVVRWTIDVIGEERLNWLRDLPEADYKEDVLLVHASPRDHIYEYILDTAVAYANLQVLKDRVCLHGHTHVPGIFALSDGQVTHDYRIDRFRLAGPCLVNPGSVGQPRDGVPLASYGIWDVDAGTFEFRRVRYDIGGAQEAIRKAKLPERFAARLETGR
ncbi:MAG TPA: metallophosphoesterase family protein [Candidatus Dormibacteraeota bacterium]|nr:metallophosphoesterase family protein [Candidatus Dormibacteraeota bacterium]